MAGDSSSAEPKECNVSLVIGHIKQVPKKGVVKKKETLILAVGFWSAEINHYADRLAASTEGPS